MTEDTEDWQPIETAPRDGTRVVLRWAHLKPEAQIVAEWGTYGGAYSQAGWRDLDGFALSGEPTHWRPER